MSILGASRAARPAALLGLVVTLALAGCTGKSPAAAASGTASAAVSASATPAPSGAASTPGSAPGDTGTPGDTAGYPADAGAYATAAVGAWAARDQTRLGQLTSGDGATIFQTLSAGDYERHFSLSNCQGAAGSTFCIFYNQAGDMLRLRLSNPRLGQPHAIMDGAFEPITFPGDAQAYAQEALDAWLSGNTARLRLLTTTEAYQHITAVPADKRVGDWTFDHSEGAAGSTYLSWTNPAGDSLAFRFINAGIEPSAGPRHRIVDVLFHS